MKSKKEEILAEAARRKYAATVWTTRTFNNHQIVLILDAIKKKNLIVTDMDISLSRSSAIVIDFPSHRSALGPNASTKSPSMAQLPTINNMANWLRKMMTVAKRHFMERIKAIIQ